MRSGLSVALCALSFVDVGQGFFPTTPRHVHLVTKLAASTSRAPKTLPNTLGEAEQGTQAHTPATAQAEGSVGGGKNSKQLEIAQILAELPELGASHKYNKAIRRYKQLQLLGGKPDGPSITGVLTACARGKVPQIAEKVIMNMIEDPPETGLQLSDFKLALKSCARGARPKEAQEILGYMGDGGVKPDIECFVMAMRSCVRAPPRTVEEAARNIMFQVRTSGVQPDFDLYAALLQVLVRAKRYQEALAAFELLCVTGSPGPEHYRLAMVTATRTKNIDVIKSLLGEMNLEFACAVDGSGMVLNEDTATLLKDATKAVADAGEWRLACTLLAKLPEPRPLNAYHAVIASCSRARNPKTAVQLFDQMRAEGLEPQRQTYNAVLHSTQSMGDFDAAKKVLTIMTEKGIRLNSVTYNIAMSARAKVGDYRGAVNLLAEMEVAGIEPTVVSYATAVHAAARGNSSETATMLVKEMGPRWGLQPTEYVYTSALKACANDPDDETAARSAQSIVDIMAETGIKDDDIKARLLHTATSQLQRGSTVANSANSPVVSVTDPSHRQKEV